MRYWKSDLRDDLENNVPASERNPAFWQHMVTFGISLGLAGTTGYSSVAAVPANFNKWPNPMDKEDSDRIDDLLHAAVNGHGDFVSAADPEAFVAGLTSALAVITERTGSFSNISANSAALSTGSSLFQASYVSGVWTGEVAAYPVTSAGAGSTPSWRASQQIPTTNRKLFTSDGTQLLAFPGSATSTQLAALTRTGGASNYPVTGADNAAYLAGTRTLEVKEGGTLRNRNHLLGDVVGSSPAYVADTKTLYVGANDGMLHAFNAETGAELFGFIPNGIDWSGLGTLSRPDYTHRYFVDGPIVVSTKAQTPGKNVLVGALGKGGKGMFALDVTTPSSPGFKWEVGATDADMGLVQSPPIIAKLNDGTTALVVSNGLNSSNGHAVLLIYNLDTGALLKKIDTGRGSAVLDDADSNGLSAPSGWDADGNGTLDYIYAGDMLGNVWKFDLSAAAPAAWGVANSNQPIFSATYTASNGTVVRQPITGGLILAMHPTTYKTWLFFGTGRLMTSGDMENKDVQSMYGFVDDGSTLVRSGANANLTQRSVMVSGTYDGKPVRAFESNSELPASSKGWYLDLLTPPSNLTEGERIVSNAQLLGGGKQTVLVTSSVIPTASACQSDGRGYINALDAFTGTSLSAPFLDTNKDGSFADDVLTTPDGQKVAIGSVDLGVGMSTLPNLMSGDGSDGSGNTPGMMCVTGSNGQVVCVPYDDVRNMGRVSWREIKRGG
ncbi:pilus assembly protein [Stenotrophomonas daejeonensis]|uniref:Pilus assembly protein n=2 Tax=Stenotrophomonas daejeonensis TaxID=659018 RepID=A0A0R0EDN3_9GAMM|nr:pilus assembly protein [Stenotrophomonas daejeonensis]